MSLVATALESTVPVLPAFTVSPPILFPLVLCPWLLSDPQSMLTSGPLHNTLLYLELLPEVFV